MFGLRIGGVRSFLDKICLISTESNGVAAELRGWRGGGVISGCGGKMRSGKSPCRAMLRVTYQIAVSCDLAAAN